MPEEQQVSERLSTWLHVANVFGHASYVDFLESSTRYNMEGSSVSFHSAGQSHACLEKLAGDLCQLQVRCLAVICKWQKVASHKLSSCILLDIVQAPQLTKLDLMLGMQLSRCSWPHADNCFAGARELSSQNGTRGQPCASSCLRLPRHLKEQLVN